MPNGAKAPPHGREDAPLPVIFVTAKAQAHEIEAYKKMGALDVISKPFDPMELPSHISAIWNAAQQTSPTSGGVSS